MPGRGLLYSFLFHEIVIFWLLTHPAVPQIKERRFHLVEPLFMDSEVLKELPAVGGGESGRGGLLLEPVLDRDVAERRRACGEGHAGELACGEGGGRVERLVPAVEVQPHVDAANRKVRTALAQRSIALDPVVALLLSEGCDSRCRHLHKKGKELVVGIQYGQPFTFEEVFGAPHGSGIVGHILAPLDQRRQPVHYLLSKSSSPSLLATHFFQPPSSSCALKNSM